MASQKMYTVKLSEAQIDALLEACAVADAHWEGKPRTPKRAATDRSRGKAYDALMAVFERESA